jgi:hypothetical protein
MPCGRSAEPYERRRWIAQPIAARGRPCWSRRSPPKAALDSRLIVSYALGSLAHGGFSPLVSDVDLGLILADPLRTIDRIAIRQMTHSLRSAGPTMCERLSVFWGAPSTLRGQSRGGRFPPLDRLDLLDHGQLLIGEDARSVVARPELAELLVAGAEFTLGQLSGAGGCRNASGKGPGSAPGAT